TRGGKSRPGAWVQSMIGQAERERVLPEAGGDRGLASGLLVSGSHLRDGSLTTTRLPISENDRTGCPVKTAGGHRVGKTEPGAGQDVSNSEEGYKSELVASGRVCETGTLTSGTAHGGVSARLKDPLTAAVSSSG